MSEYMLKQAWLKEHRNQVYHIFLVHCKYLIPFRSVTSVGTRGPRVYRRKHRSLVCLARIKRKNVQEIAVSNALEMNCAVSVSHRPRRHDYLARELQRHGALAPAQIPMGLRSNKKVPPQHPVPTAQSTASFVHHLSQDATVSRASVKSPSSPPVSPLRFEEHPENAGTFTHDSTDTYSSQPQTQQDLRPHPNIHQTCAPVDVAALKFENAELRA
ncbi:uncharacterized protein EV420DRAFT_753634 [Desarmillaria tabescens]|uniref:Uncharacterized protein n=1 Tax=Armillaria tabescens TaxID=1929756 RepID=A0AA39JWW3_ARMTA|nr:uncharacterized protein EV420DRAFT_753634 [Desarmillaria tabescens]KAK0450415.1 hypothetical protein EV420DRAFT_753634 [Desarmillaria tabescens]